MDAVATLRTPAAAAHRPLLPLSTSGRRRSPIHVTISPRPSSRTNSIRRVSVGEQAPKTSAPQMQSSQGYPDPELFSVMALSPIDGRYAKKTEDLCPFFSEFGLVRFRVLVEVKWLLKLSEIPEIKEVPNFSNDARSFLEGIIHDFNVNDALEVKKIEKVTNHDVKAVEYFLKHKCKCCTEVAEVLEFFHFACTSEDINNLAHALSLKEALNTVIFPVMVELCESLRNIAKENAHIPMLSRTHGQVMRRYGVPEPYEKLKELTRGRVVNKESIRQFIEGLDLPEAARSDLLKLSPHSYVGEANELAKVVDEVVDLQAGFKIL